MNKIFFSTIIYLTLSASFFSCYGSRLPLCCCCDDSLVKVSPTVTGVTQNQLEVAVEVSPTVKQVRNTLEVLGEWAKEQHKERKLKEDRKRMKAEGWIF